MSGRARTIGAFAALGWTVAALVGAPALAAPELLSVQDVADSVGRAAERMAEQSNASRQPLPPGEVKVLKAVVMKVTGRAEWRPNEKTAWKRAAVDDVVEPGALIRTGRRSAPALRVGRNATVRVDRNTRLRLPTVVQAGETLRTTVQLLRGRADVKVDHVGLTNDFSVMTPSTTLAVRGTGFNVDYGGLRGTEIRAAEFDELTRIEVSYFVRKLSVVLTSGTLSTEAHPNPAVAALFQTIGPPPVVSAAIEDDGAAVLLTEGFEQIAILTERQTDITNQSTQMTAEMLLEEGDDFCENELPDLTGFTCASAAEFICLNLLTVFFEYENNLFSSFPPDEQGLGRGEVAFDFPGLDQAYADVETICLDAGSDFVDQDLIDILSVINAYCEGQFQVPSDVATCVSDFADAVGTTFAGGSPQ